LARFVGIHDVEAFLADIDSLLVHLTNDSSQEFVVRNLTGAISIKDTPCYFDLLLVEVHSEVVHGLLELFLVKGLTVVIVGNLEFPTKGGDSSGTTSCYFLLDVLKDLALVGI
jgi:hypothetical protein